MATINTRNAGIATGRLTKDPVTFENSDSSKKVIVNLALRDSFKGKDGSTGSQFVDFTAFVPKRVLEGLLERRLLVGAAFAFGW